jgi:hypothetical protein
MTGQNELTNVSEANVLMPTNSQRVWSLSLFGFNRFRIRASTRTSGTLSVVIAPGTSLIEPVVSAINSNPAGAQMVAYRTVPAGVGQATVTEALLSMTGQRDLAAIAAATAQAVPAGKTFRVLGMTGWARNGAATATMMAINLRSRKDGVAITATTGEVLVPLMCPLANVIGNTNRDNYTASSSFIELLSGWTWGVSAVLGVASAASIVGCSLYGIEY